MNTWRSADVARQMVELTLRELREPDAVAPYVALRKLLEPLVQGPALPRSARLLDVGAGAGAYSELLQRWWPGRFLYTGVDYSDEIVAAARELWPGRLFECRNLFEAGTLDGYDIVLAGALVDVLPDPEQALRLLLAADAPWVVLHRQRVRRSHTATFVASGYRRQRTYSTRLSRRDLERVVGEAGRRIIGEVSVQGDVRSFLVAAT